MRLNRGAKVVLGGITLWLALYWIVEFALILYGGLHLFTAQQPLTLPPPLRLLYHEPSDTLHFVLSVLLSLFYGVHLARTRVSGSWAVKALAAVMVAVILMFIMPFGIVLYYLLFIWRQG